MKAPRRSSVRGFLLPACTGSYKPLAVSNQLGSGLPNPRDPQDLKDTVTCD